ncbi:hypothetical protein WKY82_09080 [Gordonia malaquae]|uniref:hypothetical protein n=1 Tax=Gordonia malaquae TaxID=410332 RepID=UPI0030C79D2D
MSDDDELLDRLQREQDALAEAADARERAARRLRERAQIVAKHQALRAEHKTDLSDARRDELKRQAMVLYEARTIVQHTYKPWFDDRGLADGLRVVEQWLAEAARSGDHSSDPPDLDGIFR